MDAIRGPRRGTTLQQRGTSFQADPAPEQLPRTVDADGLSREALAASLPDVAEVTADLVGWAAVRAHARLPLVPGRARSVLAAALAVPEEGLAHLPDEDAASAVNRLRALVDQCTRLAGQVTVDELTGALRRGAGLAALQREMDRSRRAPGKGLVVIFIDVDGLKAVNDRDGHAAGDDRLRETVAAIRERLRSYDLVVRYGGDEFLCVLTDSGAAEGEVTAASLRDHVTRRTGGGISVGIAELIAGDSVDALVERADAALYAGRRARAAVEPAPI
ncbi:MAG TPA: GGDEF domain-containing protein [Candidatus Dormibacteraeota bacterium]|nr:GGDEF domain-containing protein [Candidatus Dormibacteraeota bacterium]